MRGWGRGGESTSVSLDGTGCIVLYQDPWRSDGFLKEVSPSP